MKRKIKLITCEGCGANTEYFAIVDNKKLCAKCEQRTKSKNQRIIELCNQIDKLEQQLAEKDKEIEKLKQELEETNAGYDFTYEQSSEAIKELKQNNKTFMQLVKETKSESIDDFAFLVRVMNGSYIQKLRKANKRVQELEQKQTQLAIKELEKVKEFICDYSEMTGQAWDHTLRFLHDQIKELKGE